MRLPRNKPKPTHLKLIMGNPGKRPINTREPKPKIGIPALPDHLSAAAKVEWRRISKQLAEIGLLSEIDRAALAAYCQSWGRWVDAEHELAKHGTLVKSPNGYPMPSPYLSIANKAMRQMHSLLAEFGMTPSARTRLQGSGPARDEDPAEAFLRDA